MFNRSKLDQQVADEALVVGQPAEADNEIAMTASMQEAVDAVNAAVARLTQVEGALTLAMQSAQSADAEVEQAKVKLAGAEASAAVGGAEGELKAARRAFSMARDSAEFSAARVDGLHAMLAEARAAVVEAKSRLAREWKVWSQQQAEAMLNQYEHALEDFVASLKTIRAAAAALGHSRLYAITRGLALPDPKDPRKDHANLLRLRDWSDVPEAVDLHDKLAVVSGRVLPLIRELVDEPGRDGDATA